jgi:hypothetical protein
MKQVSEPILSRSAMSFPFISMQYYLAAFSELHGINFELKVHPFDALSAALKV